MIEKRENVIFGFIGDLIKFIAEIIILAAVTFVVIFALFAPAFAPYFRGRYMGEFGCGNDDKRVKSKMVMVNFVLWMICIFSWIVLLGYGLTPPDGCGLAK